MTAVDVYLDVDGVLNVLPDSHYLQKWGWGHRYRNDLALLADGTFKITWSPELVERINALAARPDVTIHWLTTWLTEAPSVLCDLVGVAGHDWSVVGAAEFEDLVQEWWKLDAIRNHAGANRIVWADDDLTYSHGAKRWAEQRGGTLLVETDPRRGITREQMEKIEAFIEEES